MVTLKLLLLFGSFSILLAINVCLGQAYPALTRFPRPSTQLSRPTHERALATDH